MIELAVAVKFLTYIREVPVSNLGGIPTVVRVLVLLFIPFR
jgi:hypothetical protein